MWISDALFIIALKRFPFNKLTHADFWTKVELSYNNPLKRLVLKSHFQNLRNLKEKNWFFHDSHQNYFKFTTGQKID